jgi:hypothetical protein
MDDRESRRSNEGDRSPYWSRLVAEEGSHPQDSLARVVSTVRHGRPMPTDHVRLPGSRLEGDVSDSLSKRRCLMAPGRVAAGAHRALRHSAGRALGYRWQSIAKAAALRGNADGWPKRPRPAYASGRDRTGWLRGSASSQAPVSSLSTKVRTRLREREQRVSGLAPPPPGISPGGSYGTTASRAKSTWRLERPGSAERLAIRKPHRGARSPRFPSICRCVTFRAATFDAGAHGRDVRAAERRGRWGRERRRNTCRCGSSGRGAGRARDAAQRPGPSHGESRGSR